MKAPLPAALCLACLQVLSLGAAPREAVVEGAAPIPLPAVVVEAKPLTSFGISLQLVAVRQTRQILRMFVREVAPGSEADTSGIEPGAEILSIDGRAVDTFIDRFDSESDLGRLFVNRRRGDRLDLVVKSPGSPASRRVYLVAGRTQPWSPFNVMDDLF